MSTTCSPRRGELRFGKILALPDFISGASLPARILRCSLLYIDILPRDIVKRALEIFRQMCARLYGEYRQFPLRKEPVLPERDVNRSTRRKISHANNTPRAKYLNCISGIIT